MENLSYLIRWREPPRHTVLLPDFTLTHRHYISQFSKPIMEHDQQIDRSCLTVINVNLDSENKPGFLDNVHTLIHNTWKSTESPLVRGHCAISLLTNQERDTNAYAIYSQTTESYYEILSNLIHTINSNGWEQQVVHADTKTRFQLENPHSPHVLTIVGQGYETTALAVRCLEPQTISHLLQSNGIKASGVWDHDIHISANASCSSLTKHGLIRMVHIDPMGVAEPETAPARLAQMGPFPDMQQVQIRATRTALKNPQEGACRPNVFVLHYMDPLAILKDVIAEDGRFRSLVHVRSSDGSAGGIHIYQVKPDMVITKGPEPVQDLGLQRVQDPAEQQDQPFPCIVCHSTSDSILECRHVVCSSCIDGLRILADNGFEWTHRCPSCRAALYASKRISITENTVFTCQYCSIPKAYVTECQHLACGTCDLKCRECESSVNKFKVYL